PVPKILSKKAQTLTIRGRFPQPVIFSFRFVHETSASNFCNYTYLVVWANLWEHDRKPTTRRITSSYCSCNWLARFAGAQWSLRCLIGFPRNKLVWDAIFYMVLGTIWFYWIGRVLQLLFRWATNRR